MTVEVERYGRFILAVIGGLVPPIPMRRAPGLPLDAGSSPAKEREGPSTSCPGLEPGPSRLTVPIGIARSGPAMTVEVE
jgi:hypothetical protein